MAKSLDELIEFLLEEIALSGESGATSADIARSVEKFYRLDKAAREDISIDKSDQPPSQSRITPDHAFLRKVWQWLGRHPDVSIGRDHQYDNIPLSDLVKDFPDLLPFGARDNAIEGRDNASAAPGESVSGPSTATNIETSLNRHEPCVYVTEDRMFIAICGHPADSTRVFPTEWQLLSHIAAARHDGILQGELTRLTGQDKRSVPKRTDALQAKGYIEKRVAYVKGNRTSRLILRRYLNSQQGTSMSKSYWNTEKLTIKYQARQLFEVLKNNPLTPFNDLADALGMDGPVKNRVLSQIIRHFGRIGCVKRVKTAFGPAAQAGDLEVCVQWLREPVDIDWQPSGDDGIDFEKSLEELVQTYSEDVNTQAPLSNEQLLECLDPATESTEKASRVVPQWNPDRILANVLFQTAESSEHGLSNIDARKNTTGMFVRRVVESLLMKVSHHSLSSQPVGLKHLSLLRSKRVSDGIALFVHYGFKNFRDLVEQGKATWADVEGGENFLKQFHATSSSASSVIGENVDRDQFGFPTRKSPTLQVRDGRITLTELMKTSGIGDVGLVSGEPVIIHTASGETELGYHKTHGQTPAQRGPKLSMRAGRSPSPRSATPEKPARTSKRPYKKRDENDEDVALGRPRKFMRGTEKFWRDMFFIAKQQQDPTFKKSHAPGLMKDPAGMRIFQNRPRDFDETLVEAIDARMPIPSEPQEINQEWINATRTVLDPPAPGLYFTPTGFQQRKRGVLSKFMTVKSSRLTEIDFSNRKTVWDWQFIGSSAAHSLSYQRYYPLLNIKQTKTSRPQRRPQSEGEKKRHQVGPPLGKFYEDVPTTLVPAVEPMITPPPSHTAEEFLLVGQHGEETESDGDLPQRIANTTTSVVQITKSGNDDKTNYGSTSRQERPIEQSKVARPNSKPPVLKRSSRKQKAAQKTVQESDLPKSHKGQGETSISRQIDEPSSNLRREEETERPRTPPSDLFAQVQAQSGPHLLDGTVLGTEAASESAQPDGTPHRPFESEVRSSDNSIRLNLPRNVQYVHELAPVTPNVISREIGSTDEARVVQRAIAVEDTQHRSRHLSHQSNLAISEVNPLSETQRTGMVEEPIRFLTENDKPSSVTADIEPAQKTDPPRRHDSSAILSTAGDVAVSRKRPRTSDREPREDSPDIEAEPPVKKAKTEDARHPITRACRKVILELVEICSGIVPSDPWTFRRAMTARWKELGVEADPPTARIVRTNITALCTGVKLKRITFAYRGKSGGMVQKSIIAYRRLDSASPEVLELQRKMIEADPADYVPPELEAEFDRVPSDLKRPRQVADKKEDEDDEDSDVVRGPTRLVKVPSKPKRVARARRLSRREDSSPSASPEPLSINTGFLTLKVPRISALDLPTGYVFKYKLPDVPPPARAIQTLDIHDARQEARRSRRGRNAGTRFDPRTHTLIWKKPRQIPLPASLDQIPNMKLSREEAAMTHNEDQGYALFEAEVDCVAAWEQKSFDLFDEEADDFVLINHQLNAAIFFDPSNSVSVEYKALVVFGEDGEEGEVDFPETRSWTPFVNAHVQPQPPQSPVLSVSSASETRPKRKIRKRKARDDEDDDDDVPKTKRRKAGDVNKRASRRQLKGKTNDAAQKVKMRRNQYVRYVSHDMRYRVILSVIIVRTLAGGIEKFVDWRLVMRLFPEHTEAYLLNIWRTLLCKYRSDVQNLTESLQEKYLDALAICEVPTVNFDDLLATDWEGILNWALTRLGKISINKIDDLPDTREEFEQLNSCTISEDTSFRDLLVQGATANQPKKDEAVSGVIFGTPICNPSGMASSRAGRDMLPPEEASEGANLVLAKSWIMALILTPRSEYDAVRAHSMLMKLGDTVDDCESVMNEAIKILQRDRMITRVNSTGRDGPKILDQDVIGVRAWQASYKFFDTLTFKRQITMKMLQTAAKYKADILDTAFNNKSTVTLVKESFLEDGEMVAVLNLLSMGAIRLKSGPDKPDTRYGLDYENHGYATKLIDKKVLGFSIIIEPSPGTYKPGDPYADLRTSISVPRGEIDSSTIKGRIPIWFDINHNFRPELWELFISAIVGLISIRPGINIHELSASLNGVVSDWEAQLIAEYLGEMGAVKKTRSGNGWETTEWWWMSVGRGTQHLSPNVIEEQMLK